jgi:uncharacterized membrane protein YoaK (UPF0700 family)
VTSNPQTREYPALWDFLILVLAVAGGSVDGVLILAFNVLTGAQTGNTVLLGVSLAQGRLAIALGSMVSVVGYVIGAALGEFILVRHDDTWPWTSAVGTVLIAELIPLGCLFIFWRLAGPHPAQQTIYMLVIYAASAMGLQAAVMLHLHGGPTTTYITGTLTAFATKLIRWVRLVETAPVSAHGRQQSILMTAFSALDGPWIHGLTWFVYLTGTAVGGLLYLYTGETALLLPIVAIVVVIAAAHHDRIKGQNVSTELKKRQIAGATSLLAESEKGQ